MHLFQVRQLVKARLPMLAGVTVLLVACSLFKSSSALGIFTEGNPQPNSYSNFKVVNDSQGAPVRLQLHDINGNILSSSDGVTGGQISLYIPQTAQKTYLVARKLNSSSVVTQPFVFGSN